MVNESGHIGLSPNQSRPNLAWFFQANNSTVQPDPNSRWIELAQRAELKFPPLIDDENNDIDDDFLDLEFDAYP